MTDTIADMLTRIRNAIAASKTSVSFPHSKVKAGIAQILKDNSYIQDFKVEEAGPMKKIVVDLFEEGDTSAINQVTRISKPGRRVYSKSQDIPRVLSGRGIVIVSTSGGLMTGQEAKKRGLGGELICKVW